MNLGDGGSSELKLCHHNLACTNRVRLCLKKKKEAGRSSVKESLTSVIYSFRPGGVAKSNAHIHIFINKYFKKYKFFKNSLPLDEK